MENILKEFQDDILIAVIRYLVPFILAALITFLGKFAGFIFSEIFTVKRILILILMFLVSLFINASLAGWITLGVFLIIIALTLLQYYLGHKTGNNIIFAGFYDVSGTNGYFSRTGVSKILDAQFFRTLRNSLAENSIQKIRPISVLSFKPPALIHSWCDYERFEHLVERYSKKSLGVVWGTVNKDGIQHIEIKLDSAIYLGGNLAEEICNRAIEVLNCTNLRSEEKSNFVAKVLAAFWGQSHTNAIAYGGDWRSALKITKESQLLFEKALNQIETQNTPQTTEMVKFARQNILPLFYVEEARSRLFSEEYEEAIEHLIKTILLNPFYPFRTASEFSEFYLARYQVQVTRAAPLKDEIIDKEVMELEGKAMLFIAPHLQFLIDLLFEYGEKIDKLSEKIDAWFSKLSKAFPDNPYIFLYWADAIKVPSRLTGFKDSDENTLPLEVMDAAIEKCEAAYALAPDLYVISSKISIMSLITSIHFPEKSRQYKARQKKFIEYAQKASIHIKDSAGNWSGNYDNYDWDKYGLTEDEIKQLVKSEEK